MFSNLKLYLNNKKDIKDNPFLKKGYLISWAEIDLDLPDIRYYEKVKMSLKSPFFYINFEKSESVNALYILLSILYNPYAFDGKIVVLLNNDPFISTKSPLLDFDRLFIKIKENNFLSLEFSNTERGENAFVVLSYTVFFKVDAWHDDDYYLKRKLKELKV